MLKPDLKVLNPLVIVKVLREILNHNFFKRSGTFLKFLGILYLLLESLLKLVLVLKVHFAYFIFLTLKPILWGGGEPKWFALLPLSKTKKYLNSKSNSLACKQL